MDLKKIEAYIHRGNLNQALYELTLLEEGRNFNKIDLLRIQIFKSKILIHMEKYDAALQLIDRIKNEDQLINNSILMIEFLLSKASFYYEKDQINEAIHVLDDLEDLLDQIKGNQYDISDQEELDFSYNYLRGKTLRKIGDLDTALKYLENCITTNEIFESSFKFADPLNVIGIIYAMKGEYERALEYYTKSLSLFDKLGNKRQLLRVLNNMGLAYFSTGILDKALDYFQRSLDLSDELKNNLSIASIKMNIGLIYRLKGDINTALSHFKYSLDIFTNLNRNRETAICFLNIGEIYSIQGEFKTALEYFDQALRFREELKDEIGIAKVKTSKANTYFEQSEYEKALISNKESLEIFEKLGSNEGICIPLFNLVFICITIGSLNSAEKYLNKLEKLNEIEENRRISQRYRLAKALILSQSDRVIKRAEAQRLLQELINEEITDIEILFNSFLKLIELLLDELRASSNKEILSEIKELLRKLKRIVREKNSYLMLTKIYWLQSRIALAELNIEKAQDLVIKAKILAEKKGFNSLKQIISTEYDSFLLKIDLWQRISDETTEFSEIIELSELDSLVSRLIEKKLFRRDEEIIEYAQKARLLAETWR